MTREQKLQKLQDHGEEQFPDENVFVVVGSPTTGLAVLFSVPAEEAIAVLDMAADSVRRGTAN